MSKRLQVLLTEQEMAEIKEAARGQGLPVGEWVRQILRKAREGRSLKDPAMKLAALERAMKMNLPTADVEQMIAESERGRWD